LFEAAPIYARFALYLLTRLFLYFLSVVGIFYNGFLEVVYQLVVVLFENLTPPFQISQYFLLLSSDRMGQPFLLSRLFRQQPLVLMRDGLDVAHELLLCL